MFDDLRREWAIRRTLRRLARQRVALILQPGNVFVVEKAVTDSLETDAHLRTCLMRGWIDVLEHADSAQPNQRRASSNRTRRQRLQPPSASA